MSYPCILRTTEIVDADALLTEFEQVCAKDLTSALAGQTAWSGVRIYDRKGVDRIAELPVLSAFLDRLGRKNVVMVNYYNMAPRSIQREHRDQSGNLLFGISRIHVALKTNAGARLRIERKDYHLPVGEIWAIDTSGRHSAVNEGDDGRVHLVIDVTRAPETAMVFPKMTVAVRLHLAKFCVIMGWKLARDAVLNPKSVLERVIFIAKGGLRTA